MRAITTAFHHKSFLNLVQHILGESRQKSLGILRGWILHTVVSRFHWIRLANQGHTTVESCHSEQIFLDIQRVAAYLNSHRKGLIIATIHMGDYLAALATLGRNVFESRRILVVRNKAWSREEAKLISRFQSSQISVTIIRHDANAARKVLRELRKGSVIILLFDLSKTWGATTRVHFLGQPMDLVRGPAELALVGQADILPVMCHFDEHCKPVAEAFSVIRPAWPQDQALAVSVNQVAQRLADIADRQIRQHPEQWHHWQLVPQMLTPADSCRAEPAIDFKNQTQD
jgi:hypothetical protein